MFSGLYRVSASLILHLTFLGEKELEAGKDVFIPSHNDRKLEPKRPCWEFGSMISIYV
jgi:hypothetical protein